MKKLWQGLKQGGRLSCTKNKLFVMAVPIEQHATEDQDETSKSAATNRFEPSSQEWRTNLFVSTNKRNYSMDLTITPQGPYAHVVCYDYPEKQTINEDKQKIDLALAQDKHPRNWDYYFKMGAGWLIVPDFAYDDGALTYLRFCEGKSFPSVFFAQWR